MIIVILCLLAGSLICIYRFKDFFHPLFIYILPITIQYSVYLLMYKKTHVLSLKTKILYFGSILIFYFSFLFFQTIFNRGIRKSSSKAMININHLTSSVLNCIGIVGVLAIIYEIFSVIGNSWTLASMYQSMRIFINYGEGFGSIAKYAPVIYSVFYACFAFNCSLDSRYCTKTGRLIYYTAIYVFFAIASFNRTNVVMSLLVFSYTFIYSRRERYFENLSRVLKIIALGCVAVFVVLALFVWISSVTFKMGAFDITSSEFFLWKYFGYPLVTIEDYIIAHPGVSKGFFSLGIIGETLIKNSFESYLPVIGVFNVFTYMGRMYFDFGMIGCLMSQIILAGIVAFIYVSNLKKGKFYTIFNAFYLYAVFISFYDYQYSLTIYMYVIVCFLMIKFLNKFTIKWHRRGIKHE